MIIMIIITNIYIYIYTHRVRKNSRSKSPKRNMHRLVGCSGSGSVTYTLLLFAVYALEQTPVRKSSRSKKKGENTDE